MATGGYCTLHGSPLQPQAEQTYKVTASGFQHAHCREERSSIGLTAWAGP